MKQLTEKIKNTCDDLIKNFSVPQKEKIILAYQKFNEYLLRLEKRFIEVNNIDSELYHKELNVNPQRTIKQIQLDLVDKMESYFQQIYSSVSAYIMLLNHVADRSIYQQMPIESTEKFLSWFLKRSYDSQLNDSIYQLQKALDFRNKYIDHPQQHALHDWMTMTHPNGAGVIIYFIRKGPEIYHRGFLNPFHPNFEPPVNYESFYVSPDYIKTYKAIEPFVIKGLYNIFKKSRIA